MKLTEDRGAICKVTNDTSRSEIGPFVISGTVSETAKAAEFSGV